MVVVVPLSLPRVCAEAPTTPRAAHGGRRNGLARPHPTQLRVQELAQTARLQGCDVTAQRLPILGWHPMRRRLRIVRLCEVTCCSQRLDSIRSELEPYAPQFTQKRNPVLLHNECESCSLPAILLALCMAFHVVSTITRSGRIVRRGSAARAASRSAASNRGGMDPKLVANPKPRAVHPAIRLTCSHKKATCSRAAFGTRWSSAPRRA